MPALYLGIDVGTGSARAGLFTSEGELVSSATRSTKMWRSSEDHRIYEQSTEDIWSAIKECISEALASAGADKTRVHGIGFDATCSLAVVDDGGRAISVTPDESCGQFGERNIILWADHRAHKEADEINKTNSVVLKYLGGSMSVRA
jgi:ribulose kinase